MAASLRALTAHSSTWIADLAVLGPEDVAVDRAANVAYVSSQDLRLMQAYPHRRAEDASPQQRDSAESTSRFREDALH
jgi:hypothetical protein